MEKEYYIELKKTLRTLNENLCKIATKNCIKNQKSKPICTSVLRAIKLNNNLRDVLDFISEKDCGYVIDFISSYDDVKKIDRMMK